jgi:coenzyme F420-reducing hydrogenase beta subunit
MDEILNDGIKVLYVIARQNEDAGAYDDQKEAVRQLKRLAVSGNPDAINALDRLQHAPDLHPFLKEIIYA